MHTLVDWIQKADKSTFFKRPKIEQFAMY